MIKNDIEFLLLRDLQKLREEIEAYQDEALIWQATPGITNSGGNLCLHLIGNLNTYIGKNLGNSGYIRDRDAEFSLKNISRERLLNDIDQLKTVIQKTFETLTDEQLADTYPDKIAGQSVTRLQFLLHLLAHLDYHLGQVNYLRRILSAG